MGKRLKLYATPLSHFARKIYILLHALDLPFELVLVEDLLSSNPEDFGGNPILRIPTLVDEETWVVESDRIAQYLVEEYDPEDRFGVLSMDVAQRNALSMINAAMGAEVEILLSQRSGIDGIQDYHYFQRYYTVIEQCLHWLETEGPFLWPSQDISYLDIALVCMWDHLAHYQAIPEMKRFAWMKKRAQGFGSLDCFRESAPKAQEAIRKPT